MSLCHARYEGENFLPVYCNKQEGHDGPHMNIDKLFAWPRKEIQK